MQKLRLNWTIDDQGNGNKITADPSRSLLRYQLELCRFLEAETWNLHELGMGRWLHQ